MKHRLFKITAPLVAAAVIFAVARMLVVSRLPSYQGRTARQWLPELITTNQMTAFKAFREMGPKALPVIVQAFEREDSRWDLFYQRAYFHCLPSVQKILPCPSRNADRWEEANLAAVNVGYAKAAVPDLTRILAESNGARQFEVIRTLINFLGPEDTNSVPVLIASLNSTNARVPILVVIGLERIGPGARAAVPALTNLADSADGELRKFSREALGKIAPEIVLKPALENQPNPPASSIFR